MKITIENTDQLVDLVRPDGTHVPARVWQGETANGVPVVCFITRVLVPNGRPPADYETFAAELREVAPPRPDLPPVDLRHFID